MNTPVSGAVVPLQPQLGFEARDLASVRVPVDLDVDEPEVPAVEQDHPRARTEDGALEPSDRLLQTVQPHQPGDRGRLAARDDEAVEAVELLGQADLDRVGTEPAQYGHVLAEIALQGQNSDPHRANSTERPPLAPARPIPHAFDFASRGMFEASPFRP